jgi:hemerythrin-like domain-containing protein
MSTVNKEEPMIPIGLLMHEHRLIERMVEVLRAEVELIDMGQPPDPDVLARMVEFFKMYADRCHHGKEEDILFKELKGKDLSPKLKAAMDELLDDHVRARELVGRVDQGRTKILAGDGSAAKDIRKALGELLLLYPDHIEREDKHFFFPVMDVFSKEEKDAMLEQFWEFDKRLIHEKYGSLVKDLEEHRPQPHMA